MKIRVTLGVVMVFGVMNSLNSMDNGDTTSIPGASYYKIHGSLMCELHITRDTYSIKKIEKCSDHHELAPLLQGNNTILALYNRSHQRIFLRNNTDRITKKLYREIQKLLDPENQLQAVKGIITHSLQHGRVLVLYDQHNQRLIKLPYEGPVQLMPDIKKQCERYFDMSTLISVEEEK